MKLTRLTMETFKVFILSTTFLLVATSRIFAVTYYVSNTGNDALAGTSQATAWKTIDRVVAGNYAAGSKIAFKGGQTFTGEIDLSEYNCGGTPLAPVTITSFGTGKATISSGNNLSGLFAFNVAGLKIMNLNFRGTSRAAGIYEPCGIIFYNELLGGVHLDGVTITNVNISGYGGHGIYFYLGNSDCATSISGYKNVSITKAISHDNGKDGILFLAPDSVTCAHYPYPYQNVYIADSVVYNNSGDPSDASWAFNGDGILLGGVDGGTVERCTAYNNGWNMGSSIGGIYGIWAYESNNLMFQYNESYNQRIGPNRSWDCGGFDFGHGVNNSVLQYNYAHGNDGPGILIDNQLPTVFSHVNNTIRYNILENNGRRNGQGEIYMSGQIEGTRIYNNTLYTNGSSAGWSTTTPALLLCLPWHEEAYGTVVLHNNIFLTTAGKPQIKMMDSRFLGGLYMDGNIYWNQGGGFNVDWAGQTYTDMTLWQWASGGQELGGYNMDPGIKSPGAGITVRTAATYTASLNKLLPKYGLKSTSGLIDWGWELTGFGWDVGTNDIFKQPIPVQIHPEGGFDIGAAEYQPGQ